MPLVAIGFLKKFGPWIMVGLAALFVYGMAGKIVGDWKQSIFEDGEKHERDRQDQIARKIEERLAPILADIDENTKKKLDNQTRVETKYVERIRENVKNNPVYSSCAIDDGVLGDRNEIRRSLKAALDSATGTDAKPEADPAP